MYITTTDLFTQKYCVCHKILNAQQIYVDGLLVKVSSAISFWFLHCKCGGGTVKKRQ